MSFLFGDKKNVQKLSKNWQSPKNSLAKIYHFWHFCFLQFFHLSTFYLVNLVSLKLARLWSAVAPKRGILIFFLFSYLQVPSFSKPHANLKENPIAGTLFYFDPYRPLIFDFLDPTGPMIGTNLTFAFCVTRGPKGM